MRILFLINNLGGGGAERVLVNLVNHMDYTKYDITVKTIFDVGVVAVISAIFFWRVVIHIENLGAKTA